jgi:parallel beta-helix repeat protein
MYENPVWHFAPLSNVAPVYTPHGPIVIYGNSGFTSENGVVDGSGTASDPYVIRGWEIDGTGYENAIYILYSNVYFEIMDCHLHNADVNGINLYAVTNGLLFNNSCTDNLLGILIQDSGTNTVSNNSISNNANAGIYLVSSTGMILRNNTFVNNGIYMSNGGLETHDIDTSNTVNGKPVYYYKYQIGGTVPAGAGQVLLTGCQNMVVENQLIDGASSGIMLADSSNNLIRNNTCSGNSQHGIGLQYSNSNILFNNSLSSNGGVGIYVYSSSSNTVWNNTFYHNNGAGDAYDPSHVQAFDIYGGNSWNSPEGYGNWWSDWTTPDVVPPFGIVDVPYDIAGGAGAKDYYPLVVVPWTGSHAPVALFDYSPTTPRVGELVTFDASASYDPEGDIVGYHWAFSDGTTGDGAIVTHTYAGTGVYDVTLTVADSGGLTSQASAYVSVFSESGFIPHGAIRIYSNVDFTSENGVVRGSGTLIDPYVIEGWQIDAAGQNGISLSHTTAYLVIRNVIIDGGGGSTNAISLFDCRNVCISHCTLSSAGNGTYIDHSKDIVLTENQVSQCKSDGIFIEASSRVRILQNEIRSNGWAPFHVWPCGVTIEDQYRPSTRSDNITVGGNVIQNNLAGAVGIGWFTYDTSDILVVSNTITGNVDSVWTSGTRRITISGNLIEDNQEGVYLEWTSGAKVYGNNFVNNGRQGYDDRGAENQWNDVYPIGGNYWSDYSGSDLSSGPAQNINGRDGIGDTPYVIDSNSGDRYPLMSKCQYNTPPKASLAVDPNAGSLATVFKLSASSSWDMQDPDSLLSVRWDFDGDGVWDTDWGAEKEIQHQYASTGLKTIRLEVRDTAGLTSDATASVFVAWNMPLLASFMISPSVGRISTDFLFDASSSYDPNDPLGSLQVRWDWEGDGAFDTGWSTDKIATHTYSVAGSYSPIVEVRGSGGLTSQTSRFVSVFPESGYIPHGAIRIYSNNDFTPYNGVVRGAGTSTDPFIIEGWEISSSPGSGIEIWNADVHFVVQDCYVHDCGAYAGTVYLSSCSNGMIRNCIIIGGSSGDGIQLSSCDHNRLINNTCRSDYGSGLVLLSSSYNTLASNTVSSNRDFGMYLGSSSDNTIINNTCNSNGYNGIHLDSTSNNAVCNNTCSWNNWNGIVLGSSSDNTLINNTCNSNGDCGMHLYSSTDNILINNNCSSNNGAGMVLESSSDGNTLIDNTCSSNDGSGIWHVSSNDNTMTNNNCSANDMLGIGLDYSNNNTICDNTCSWNNWNGIHLGLEDINNTICNNTCISNGWNGIGLGLSSNNTIRNNTCISNVGNGIGLVASSDGNTICNNTCNLNDQEGIMLGSSNDNTICDNICSWNNGVGMGLYSSSNNTVFSNTISSNSWYGMELMFSSDNNSIFNNTCSSDEIGMYLYPSSDNNTICDNTCSSNNQIGIAIVSSSDNTLCNNTCSNNVQEGMWLLLSSDNTLINNKCSSNNGDGINLDSSDSNSLINNTCNLNGGAGISLEADSDANNLVNNTCNMNSVFGINLYSGPNGNSLINNICNLNGDGIFLTDSDNNILVKSTCLNNGFAGIYLGSDSCGNALIDNKCSNGEAGIFSDSSCQNILKNNTCSNNSIGIILYSNSGGNSLISNTCSNNTYGIGIQNSDGNSLINNTCSSNNLYGIAVFYSSSNSVTDNTCSDNVLYGLFIHPKSSCNNRIWNNTFYHNNGAGDFYDRSHVQARDDGTNNWWNSTDGYGNKWSDWRGPDLLPPDGIVDIPYRIDGTAHSRDYYPIAEYSPTPSTLIENLIQTIQGWNLPNGVSSGLISKLSDAIALLDRGNVNGAMHKLMDFVSMVHALEGKKLTSAQADYALTSAETIIELLT